MRGRPLLLSTWFFPRLPRLIRTRLAICASFFIQGLMFATWCARIPDVRVRLGLNEAQLGSLLLMLPIGQFLAIVPSGWLVARLGSRRMLVTAGFLYPSVLCFLGVAPNAWLLGAGLFLAGFAANLSNTAANTQGVQLEHYYRRSIIALFHGMWSLAGLVAVALSVGFAYVGAPVWLHFGCVAAGACALLSFSGGALMGFDRAAGAVRAGAKGRAGGWKLTPMLLWLGVASLGCMACEGTIYDWSGIYLRDVVRVDPAQQSLGYLAYLCTMVTMRFVVDGVVNRLGVLRVLLVCGVCISGGLALAVGVAGLTPAIALGGVALGFALVGCGTSAVVPLCCGLAGKVRGVSPSIAIAEISTIGFFGFLATPPLIGFVAHAFNLRVAFAMMSGIGLLVLVATVALRRSREVNR
ncbi:MAG: MFS transporter [Lentisphaeraceae bacterium]|nr:MFS transporter [Lentisphaeraceae bacterium]